MSFDFAGVLTGKATNFIGGPVMPFLERRHEVHVGLLRTVTSRSQCVVRNGFVVTAAEEIRTR